MAPTRNTQSRGSSAFLRRFSMLLLSSTLVLLLGGSALAAIGDDGPLVDTSVRPEWQPGDVADLAILVGGLDAGDSVIDDTVVPELAALEGIASVEAVPASNGRVAILAAFDADADGDEVLPEAERTLESLMPDAQLSLGGRAVADSVLLERLNRGVVVAVVPVIILLTVLLAASFGIRVGLAAGGTVAMATLLGGLMGAQLAGRFDGSLGTTALPAVLVATLVSTVLGLRLLDWFKHPIGEDSADAIRRAVRHLAPEAALLVGGVLLTAFVLAVAGPGRNQAGVVAVGAFFGAVVTFAILPSILATLPPVVDDDEYRMFRLRLPDGRDLPTAVLAGFAVFLVSLGLFATRVPSTELLDESALPAGNAAERVAEELAALGGDPTSAILASMPESATQSDIDQWAARVSDMAAVGWVATASGRFEEGAPVSGASDPARFVDNGQQLAVVTPAVPARSVAAQDLVEVLGRSNEALGEAPELEGAPVEAAAATSRYSLRLWLLIGTLAVVGGLAVLALVGDIKLALLSIGLRLLGSAGVVGAYSILINDASGTELQMVALIASVGVGLFEIGFIRRLATDAGVILRWPNGATGSDSASGRADAEDSEQDPVLALLAEGSTKRNKPFDWIGDALREEGMAAMLGVGVAALCGLGLVMSDLAMVRRFGVALALCFIVELLIASWLLRPVILGRRVLALTHRSGRVDLDSLVTAPEGAGRGGGVDLGGSDATPDREAVGVSAAPGDGPGLGSPADGPDSDGLGSGGRFGGLAVAGAAVSSRVNEIGQFAVRWRDRRRTSPALDDDTDAEILPPLPAMPAEARAEEAFVATVGGTDDSVLDPQWRRVVSGLLRAEFAFQVDPDAAELESVFVTDTPVFSELADHNRRLRAAGFRVEGEGPRLLKVRVVNEGSPVTLAVTVDHPERRLLDRNGRVLGVRQRERRDGMLWLIQDPSGRYRIAEAIDLGTAEPELSSGGVAADTAGSVLPA